MQNSLIDNLIQINKRRSGVLVRDRKSKFITPFWEKGKKPDGVLCCQFYEAKWSNGCMYDCGYCYLRGTFRWQEWNGREQTIFSNVGELFREVDEFLKQERPTVLHTGEVSDSLAVPGSEKIMAKLIEKFAQQDKHTLLLLTKSNNIKELLDLKHNRRTVIAFSINPASIARRFEKGAASTDDRLRAAKQCIKSGYKVMVRVDPMIPVKGWRQQYKGLFNQLNKLQLYGVVVGTLRAFSGLKPKMTKELSNMLEVREKDRRWHLEQELRDEMYSLAFSTLNAERMGLCKEAGRTWGLLGKKYGYRKFICNCHLQE
ncbi:MAG TPA: radical SAM protein [Nitrososphaera sp.]|jgi:spore photoproduct lyase|nr:radical SAM protein [Nitrososphaera sp.]